MYDTQRRTDAMDLTAVQQALQAFAIAFARQALNHDKVEADAAGWLPSRSLRAQRARLSGYGHRLYSCPEPQLVSTPVAAPAEKFVELISK